MAEDRKVFPVEEVLELVMGKDGANTTAITTFITGKANLSPAAASAAAPFASAWLARWYPRFMEMEWKKDQSWESFVKQAKNVLGDNISLTPMSGRLKTVTAQALDVISDTEASLARQTEAVIKLEKEVGELKPLEARADTAQKKCDELEARIKTMKTEMTALNRKTLEFDGKMAIDHEELMQNIRDAIKDGLKGLSLGAAVADTIESASGSEAPQSENDVPDDFGFGTSSPDADGFGF